MSALSCLCLLILTPGIAAAEDTHTFDATLSLVGKCGSTSTIDPVEDPGCPGGAHPPLGFSKPSGVAVDPYGDRYVINWGAALEGQEGRVDVFGPSGNFLTEVTIAEPISIAVDSLGNMYVLARNGNTFHYEPSKYDHAAGEIEYADPPVALSPAGFFWSFATIAINPSNDHLFKTNGAEIQEWKSAAEGNEYLGAVIESDMGVDELNQKAFSMALDAVRNRIYVTDNGGSKAIVDVFELSAPYKKLFVIDGSTTEAGRFTSLPEQIAVAADEGTGHIFVGDLGGSKKVVYEYDEAGNPVSTIPSSFALSATGRDMVEIAVDDGPTSATQGYLFVGSGAGNPGHSYAFAPIPPSIPPVVEELSVSGITNDEAILHGKVNPNNSETSYRFEYTTEESFEAKGFEGASVLGAGTVGGSFEGIPVRAAAGGLEPGTAYRFRLVAESEEGEDEAEATFATYSTPVISSACPNQSLRIGPSAVLPDCRAYELVTPANTNGHPPYGQQNVGARFPSSLVSPSGEALSFGAEGGAIPGTGATGGYQGDPYVAKRTGAGWQTEYAGPAPDFSTGPEPGGISPDQGYTFWAANEFTGPAVEPGIGSTYVRYPDGHSELIGKGSIATDPKAIGLLISENGGHVIFRTQASIGLQLEPNAAPDGTTAIYDRTPDGNTHVVSLLPGEEPLGAGQNAAFAGASLDGRAVAFRVGDTLYLRHDNAVTYEIGEGIEFAGVAEGGGRVFYLEGGDLYAFDVQSKERIRFTETGDATIVNVAADGSAAYFVSPQALAVAAGPAGGSPEPGGENLYLSREGALSFVGTVTQRDVEGIFRNYLLDGLGLWVATQNTDPWGTFASDASRTTADGGVLLFQSRAKLTDYDPQGHVQIYRYDSVANTLGCLSCNPTGPPDGETALQDMTFFGTWLNFWNAVDNLSADGERAFFESTEALVLGDTDGLRDVYEWEEEGKGNCQTPGGCLYLISSGSSGRDEYLLAVSDSGNDVFFKSAELLSPDDPDETPSIYDARVNGGFAPPQRPTGECLGEACQPAADAPQDLTPATATVRGAGNVAKQRGCGSIARRAARHIRWAKRFRRQAKTVKPKERAKRLRRSAKRHARRAKLLAKRTKRCRRAVRRAAR